MKIWFRLVEAFKSYRPEKTNDTWTRTRTRTKIFKVRSRSSPIGELKNHQSESLKQITNIAAELFGDPQGFWRDFNTLSGGKKTNISSLKVPPDTDGFVEGSIVSDPSEKTKSMGICWEKIFHPNKGPEFINDNTKMVNAWYRSIKVSLQHDEVIDFSNLNDSHPTFRCITVVEFHSAINQTADKAPGKRWHKN